MNVTEFVKDYWSLTLGILAAIYFVVTFYNRIEVHITVEEPKIEELSSLASDTKDVVEDLASQTAQQIELNKKTEALLKSIVQEDRDQRMQAIAFCKAGKWPKPYCDTLNLPAPRAD